MLDRLGSSDVGNVSQVIPTIQPMIGIAPLGTADPHARVRGRRRAAAGARRPARRRQGMALTTFDLLADPARVRAAKEEFARSR